MSKLTDDDYIRIAKEWYCERFNKFQNPKKELKPHHVNAVINREGYSKVEVHIISETIDFDSLWDFDAQREIQKK